MGIYKIEELKSFRVSERRRKVKSILVAYKGGECVICGYNKCNNALHFHHLDPDKKDFSLSGSGFTHSIDCLKQEADKCILLCANCHAEIHSIEFAKVRKEKLKYFNLPEFPEKKQNKSMVIQCHQCNADITVYPSRFRNRKFIFCSQGCKNLYYRRVSLPTEEELNKLLWEMPTTHIAKKFGVSDKAVERWAKKFNLNKPPRGYWAKKNK